MVIKASPSAEIRTLIEALSDADEVPREAAIARLAIIGARTVDRLIDEYGKTADRRTHVAILRALEAIGDYRSGRLARQAIASGGDVAVAAAAVLRTLLTSPHNPSAVDALDTLVAVALDRTSAHRLRFAALEALQDLPGDLRARIDAAVQADPGGGLREAAQAADTDAARADAIWRDAVEGRLPDDPNALREAMTTRAAAAPLNTLRRMIDAVRAKEREGVAGWLMLRGSLHQALALRGSRVALYDVRESLEGDERPLPVSFLAALHALGDVSCLEPLAAAWSRAALEPPGDNDRWRGQLALAFRAIARRERITRRHAVIKRIAAKWPGAAELWSG